MESLDLIVVGGGHAGIEAALAGARMGKKTLLITMQISQIGAISCNPAIGGLAKGHLVREIDALGGEMGLLTDKAGIQFRILNASKGPAVRGSRAQIDMDRYTIEAKEVCLNTPNLSVKQEMVEELIVEGNRIVGVKTALNISYRSNAVILTTGTFLNGLVHVGEEQIKMGRMGELPADRLGTQLGELGLTVGRLKTGTCPRIIGKSIDFSVTTKQENEESPIPFSFRTDRKTFKPNQLPCYITHTNATTHEIIRSNFHRAPMFTGQIASIGPRYCPSVEDKINRFGDRESHQIFIEPQNSEANEYYINGLSTSLPTDVQIEMVRSVKGLENAIISRWGYAIEYDFVEPTDLDHTLKVKNFEGLYLAGQLIGTTGYEEAAALGMMAAINAVLAMDGKEPFILGREEAYIGVMIDDLVTKGTKEPYRMFTSRAEHRLALREDNADLRVSKYGYKLGLITDIEFAKVVKKQEQIDSAIRFLEENYITNSKENVAKLEAIGEEKVVEKTALINIASRPTMTIEKLEKLMDLSGYCESAKEQIMINAKYHHYLKKQDIAIRRMDQLKDLIIPETFEFRSVSGLSNEIVQKLEKSRPKTLYDASQISGVTPAAIDILGIYIKLKK